MKLEKPLEGNKAWLSLAKVLKGNLSAEGFCCSEMPLERLRLSINDIPDPNLSEKDRLVRLRQALRYGSIKLKQDSLPLPKKGGWPDKKDYAEFGMRVSAGGYVTAKPWNPEWLEEKNAAVDKASMGAGVWPAARNTALAELRLPPGLPTALTIALLVLFSELKLILVCSILTVPFEFKP